MTAGKIFAMTTKETLSWIDVHKFFHDGRNFFHDGMGLNYVDYGAQVFVIPEREGQVRLAAVVKSF